MIDSIRFSIETLAIFIMKLDWQNEWDIVRITSNSHALYGNEDQFLHWKKRLWNFNSSTGGTLSFESIYGYE